MEGENLIKIKSTTIEIQTKKEMDFIDITQKVEDFVNQTKIKNGFVNIQSLHTSAALILNENEPLLIEDFKKNLEATAPKNFSYQHDDMTKRTVNVCPQECINGHSHCKAIHLPASITLNLINGELQLGQWQRIFFVELDRSRKRKIQIQIIGV